VAGDVANVDGKLVSPFLCFHYLFFFCHLLSNQTLLPVSYSTSILKQELFKITVIDKCWRHETTGHGEFNGRIDDFLRQQLSGNITLESNIYCS